MPLTPPSNCQMWYRNSAYEAGYANTTFDSSYNTAITVIVLHTSNPAASSSLKNEPVLSQSTNFNLFNYSSTSNQYTAGGSNGAASVMLVNVGNLTPNSITQTLPLTRNTTVVSEWSYNGTTQKLGWSSGGVRITKTSATTGNLGASGVIQVGGSLLGFGPYAGTITEFLVFNRALTDTEIETVRDYLMGTQTNFADEPTDTHLVLFDGDSITLGSGANMQSQSFPEQWRAAQGGASVVTMVNYGIGSAETTYLTSNAAALIDPIYNGTTTRNQFLVFAAGSNDLGNYASPTATPASVWSNIQTYAAARRAAGWYVYLSTILPRNGATNANYSTVQAQLNTLIRAGWPSCADGLVDFAANANLGTWSGTYYADGVHPNSAGYAIMASLVTAELPIHADHTLVYRSDIRTDVLTLLGDTANAIWTAAEINNYIQFGYNDLCMQVKGLFKIDWLDDVADTATATLPTDFQEIDRVTWDWRRLPALTANELRQAQSTYQDQSSDPIAYSIDTDGVLTLRKYPAPSATATANQDDSNTRLEYFARPTALSADTVKLLIPARYTKYIRHYALWRALERRGDGQDLKLAGHYRQRYDAGIERIKRRMGYIQSLAPMRMGGSNHGLSKNPIARRPYNFGTVAR